MLYTTIKHELLKEFKSMKKLYLIVCIIALTGCQKAITDEDLMDVKYDLTDKAADLYLDKYNQKGTYDRIYQNFKFKDEYFSVSETIEQLMYKCSHTFQLKKSDIENKDGSSFRKPEFGVKKNVSVDYTPFNTCLDNQLNSTPLNYKNLEIFSNDPEIQKYKQSDPAIGALVTKAKSDGEISYLEALNIYLAVYKQTEKDLFSKI